MIIAVAPVVLVGIVVVHVARAVRRLLWARMFWKSTKEIRSRRTMELEQFPTGCWDSGGHGWLMSEVVLPSEADHA